MSDYTPVLGISDEPADHYYKAVLGEASNSGLKQIAQSPAHYRLWALSGPSESTPAMRFGTAFHAYLLEPESFARNYIEQTEFAHTGASNIGKAERAAFLIEANGRNVITADDHASIRAMADAVHAHPIARSLVGSGRKEVTLRWIDERTGLPCKARVDNYLDDMSIAVDLKTTPNADPFDFARSSARYRYHCQEVFYREGFRACGHPLDHFLFVNVEKEAPYGVSVVYHDDSAKDRANALIARDMDTLARCVDSQSWPCYPQEIVPLTLPAWAFYD